MKTIIEIILALIAAYSAFSWGSWLVGYRTGQLHEDFGFPEVQFSMIGSGLCCILALGFLGLML